MAGKMRDHLDLTGLFVNSTQLTVLYERNAL